MNLYEYLSSVPSVIDKKPFIKEIIDSGRKKFVKYTYEYVPGLTDAEKEYLKSAMEEQNRERS